MFNVCRSNVSPPESLSNKKNYNEEDVLKALKEIFFDKCYLCETKRPQDIQIEHFRSHLGDLDKKFDWHNLYFACSRCNNIKGAQYTNLLDCCDKNINVCRAIRHKPPTSPQGKSVTIEAMNNDERTEETAKLLEEIFNSNNTINKKISADYLRRKVFEQYNKLLDQINIYYGDVRTDEEKSQAVNRMKILIDRSQPYSAFIRWCILDDAELAPLLDEFID